MRNSHEKEQIAAVTERIEKAVHTHKLPMPPAPNLLTRICELTTDSDSELADIAAILEPETEIKNRLIRLANSVTSGARKKIHGLQAAITRLGLSRLQALATSLVLRNYLQTPKNPRLVPHFHHLWMRSTRVAVLSYLIAANKTTLEAEQALLAGLVHNIGAVPLFKALAEAPEVKYDPALLPRLLKSIVPRHYPEVGAQLLSQWQMPESLQSISLSHPNLNFHHSGGTRIDDITVVAFQLSSMVDFCNEDVIPEKLVSSEAFQRIWPDWPTAVADLSTLTEKLSDIQRDLAH